jgi:predicted aspartyl protease
MDISPWPAHATGSKDGARRRATGALEQTLPLSAGDAAMSRVPTHRDRFGRILAPVRINNKGPFYLVVNSGASTVAIADHVARRLNVRLDEQRPIIVHGVTSTSTVPALRNASITLGGVAIPSASVPVLAKDLEDSDGMLGLIGLRRDHVRLDFLQHHILLSTHATPAPFASPSTSLPMDACFSKLLVIDTHVQGIRVKTIIDTGAESTMGNVPMQFALAGLGSHLGVAGPIIGMAKHGETEASQPLPPVRIGDLRILGAHICYSSVPLFERVGLGNTPAMLLGMNILSKMAHLGFDFNLRTVHFGPPINKSGVKTQRG